MLKIKFQVTFLQLVLKTLSCAICIEHVLVTLHKYKQKHHYVNVFMLRTLFRLNSFYQTLTNSILYKAKLKWQYNITNS